MDELHHSENWPFVSEGELNAGQDESVSPEEQPDRDIGHAEGKRDYDDAYDTDDADSEDLTAISPIQSRSSFGEDTLPMNWAEESQPRSTALRQAFDELYDNDDEERDIITPIHTPIPSSGVDGFAETSDPFDAVPANRNLPPTARSTGANGSFTQPLLRRTPSITAQIPLNRQRVRYSWQSVQDEEPNRPRINVIKLVSNTATASAGFPQGEAFGFSISPFGRRIAVFNSARLYILQSEALPVGISQDYALKRRPVAVEVVDEGNTIAILADEHTVNIYDLEEQELRRVKTIKLDYPCSCIALSTTGALLAAGYEGGVEVFSLHPTALPTDRRAVRSHRVDKLMFSRDGSTLIGTTTRINASSTVVISVPVFPTSSTGIPSHDELKEAWCSELLQPDNIRNSSHATFMREDRQICNDRLFAWNGLQDTFGILKVPDMMYSNVDFPVVISPPLSTLGGLGAAIHCCPAVDEHGDAVAMVVNDRTVRLYLVPRNTDETEMIVEAHSIDHELDEGYGCPFTDIRWVHSGGALALPDDVGAMQVRGRLLVASPGAVIEHEATEEMAEVEDLEGGRIIMFDFDPQYAGQPGQTFSLTLGSTPPQTLEEANIDVAHEIAIMRRRTVNQNKVTTLNQRPINLGRSAISVGNRTERSLRAGTPTITANNGRRIVMTMRPEGVTQSEEPYAQNAPRSQDSLQRAASNVQRHRFQTLEERIHEHASLDSNDNFLPLPEYTEEPNAPLPSRFRAMAGLDGPAPLPATKPSESNNTAGRREVSSPTPPSSQTPTPTVDTFARQNTDVAARDTQLQRPRGDSLREETSVRDTPPLAARPDVRAQTAQLPQTTVPTPSSPAAPSPTPRFLQRAYGNAAFSTMRASPSPRLLDGWETAIPRASAQFERPRPTPSPLDRPSPIDRSPHRSNGLYVPGQWDVSPLPSPSTPATPNGLQYSRSTSQLASPARTPLGSASIPFHRAASSAGSSFAPSIASSGGITPYYGDVRLPPHMQAFRTAAPSTNSATASIFQSTQSATHIPVREPGRNANGATGYPITAWHPPAPSSPSALPSSEAGRSNSLPDEQGKSGFFRRGTKMRKKASRDVLFGPEFAGQQPGASAARPGTAESEGGYAGAGGAKSVFETKSVFTVKTKRGDTRCVVM